MRQNEVQLTAGTGDVLEACSLGVHLTEQVDVHSVVDGNKVIQCGDAADVVGVVHGCRHALRIIVQVIVHLLGAGTEGVDLTALVQLLACTGDLAGLAISTKASTYISVCTPRSFKSLCAIRLPMALGIPPMPAAGRHRWGSAERSGWQPSDPLR